MDVKLNRLRKIIDKDLSKADCLLDLYDYVEDLVEEIKGLKERIKELEKLE